MVQAVDRSVLVGSGLLACMMVGIATISYLNIRDLRDNNRQGVHSREVIDSIRTIRTATRQLQASQRSFLLFGTEERLKPFQEAAEGLRAEVAQLKRLTAGNADQAGKTELAAREIEDGIASMSEVANIRRHQGLEGFFELARVRGNRSFVDPLLDTLAEMDRDERARLAAQDQKTEVAYSQAVFFALAAGFLGLLTVGLFVWVLLRSAAARARAAALLAEQREWFRVTLASIGDAVIATDTAGRVAFLNPVAAELTQWDERSAIGRPLAEVFRIVKGTTRAVVANPALRALHEGVAVGLAKHTLLIARDGTERPLDDSAAPIRGPDGEVRGAVLVFRDISEKKAAERALREREERYRLLVNATSDVVYTMSADWSEMQPLDGRGLVPSNAEPKRDWMEANLPRSEHARVRDTIDRAIREKRTFELEHQVFRADGSLGWTFSRAVPILDAAGDVVNWFGTARDVTERKRLEIALKEQDRKKDDFIALLAHELRNPLAPIRNGLQVLRLSNDGAIRERAQAMMDRQLAHMVRLIDDLLDVSRINRNKLELRLERVTLDEVLSSAVETARPAIEEAGHTLTVTLPALALPLEADLTRLSQVFSNLLTNSARYTERGGAIWLTAEARRGEIVVSVRDTGIGIPAAMLPKIFDMFSQGDRPTERSAGGLGIGLALVKGLVEMHGGTVAVDSAGEGRGSTFTVTLRGLPGQWEKPAAPDGTRATPGRARRILVVDDNRDAATSLALVLGLRGDEVRTVYDGLAAVAEAERFDPQVILMDLGMPNLNGLDATRRIREQPWGKDMIIIALTGWGQERDKERSRAAGCTGHLVKPVSLSDLKEMLESVSATVSGPG